MRQIARPKERLPEKPAFAEEEPGDSLPCLAHLIESPHRRFSDTATVSQVLSCPLAHPPEYPVRRFRVPNLRIHKWRGWWVPLTH
jgi:hypothetical protein